MLAGLKRYELLIVAVLCDAVLVVGSVVNDVSPHIAAQWAGVLTTAAFFAHTGLEYIRTSNNNVPFSVLNADPDKIAKEVEGFVDPAVLSEAQKQPNPPKGADPIPPVIPEPAQSAEDKLRAQLISIGQTPAA